MTEHELKKAQKRHIDLTARFYENMRKEQESVRNLDRRVARELSSLDDRLKKLERHYNRFQNKRNRRVERGGE